MPSLAGGATNAHDLEVIPVHGQLLPEAVRASLDRDAATAYVVDGAGRLVYVNPAWHRFAAENGNDGGATPDPIGANIWSAVPPVLRVFYRRVMERAHAHGELVEYDYECSSPQRQRFYHARVEPVGQQLVLARHSLRVERTHPAEAHRFEPQRYVNESGLVAVCANCRRTRTAHDRHVWHWVPELVEVSRPNITHALCEPCLELYYPDDP